MKTACWALALLLVCQVALAQNPGQPTSPPFQAQPPASAQHAEQAPRWNPSPPAEVSGPVEPARLPSLGDGEDAPRPIQSIMKRRSPSPGAGGVVPAQYNAPLTSGTTDNSTGTAAPSTSPPSSIGSRYEVPSPAQGALAAPSIGAAPVAEPDRKIEPVTETPASPIHEEELPAPPTDSSADAAAKAAARAATDLLAGSLEQGQDSSLSDRPLSLLEALSATPAADTNRLSAIRAYWRLSCAFSQYLWARDELKRLEQIVPSRGSIESSMLSTDRAEAEARLHDAELAVRDAQETLVSAGVWQTPGQDGGYFPSDQPLVGPYLTYYDMLFANRSAPGRVRQIHRTLPLRLSVINDRAAAVQAASSAVHYAEEAHARSQVDLATVLACDEELHRQRSAFLDAVEQYNAEIAEYAATVAGPGTTPDRLVSMLIRAKQPDRVSTSPAGAPSSTSPSGAPSKSQTAGPASGGWTASVPRSADDQPTPATMEPLPATLMPDSPQGDSIATPATVDPFKPAVR